MVDVVHRVKRLHVIHRIKEFQKELKVGDVFWHMTSDYGVPCEIVGPCTIILLRRSFVRYMRLEADAEVIEEESIGDLVNQHHGVFLNSMDAYEYFEARRAEARAEEKIGVRWLD